VRPTWLIRLYPREWRQRYGEEMCALLGQHKATYATFFDLLLGALDAHLDPQAWRKPMSFSPERLRKLRTAAATPFGVFPLFFVLWFVISRGDDSWRYLREINPLASVVYDILYIGQTMGSELSLAFLAALALEFCTAAILALHAVRSESSDTRQSAFELVPLAACILVVAAALVRGKFDWLGTVVSLPLVLPLLIGLVLSKAALNESTIRLVLVASILVVLTMVTTLAGIFVLQVMAAILLPSPAWPLQLVPGFVGICILAASTLWSLWRSLNGGTAPSVPPDVGRANA
jgi:hypothetical protein